MGTYVYIRVFTNRNYTLRALDMKGHLRNIAVGRKSDNNYESICSFSSESPRWRVPF